VQPAGVVRVGVRQQVVPHVGLAVVEAVDDEAVQRRPQPLHPGVLRRHGASLEIARAVPKWSRPEWREGCQHRRNVSELRRPRPAQQLTSEL
jgi:hypothetical protein